MKLGYMTTLLSAAAAALAIGAAPIASAADNGPATTQQSCGTSGTGTVCESPGNVQINDSPPPVGFYPYGGDAFLLGGGGGGGFHAGVTLLSPGTPLHATEDVPASGKP
jgi:hypothetical protein